MGSIDSGSSGAVTATERSVSILAASVDAPCEEPQLRTAGMMVLQVIAAPLPSEPADRLQVEVASISLSGLPAARRAQSPRTEVVILPNGAA